ncbi:WD40 repeat domain-containing protein [Amycolatopsis lurida]
MISIAFAPDGRTVAASDGDRAVPLWDPETGEQREQLTSNGNPVSVLRYGPDGTRVAAVQNGVVQVFAPGGGAPRTFVMPGREPRALVISPDGKLIEAASSRRSPPTKPSRTTTGSTCSTPLR